MRTDLERNITEAMRISDYNEMLVRIELMQRRNKEHGEISVSAGYGNKGEKIVQSNTTFHTSPGDTTTHTRVDTLYQSATADTTMSDAMIHSKDGLDILLRDHNSITNMAAYIQRGMHSGLDIFIEPSFATYDSLLNARLREMDIDIRYRLQYLYSGYDAYDRWLYTDTLATGGTPGYIPGPDAVSYQYAFSSSEHDVYRLTTEPLGNLVLRQMAGILTTSLVILLILGFSFWYLIRTILRQKTLEEMKSDFTNNITHELKTPIAVAYAATDALLNFHQADDPGKRERYLPESRQARPYHSRHHPRKPDRHCRPHTPGQHRKQPAGQRREVFARQSRHHRPLPPHRNRWPDVGRNQRRRPRHRHCPRPPASRLRQVLSRAHRQPA